MRDPDENGDWVEDILRVLIRNHCYDKKRRGGQQLSASFTDALVQLFRDAAGTNHSKEVTVRDLLRHLKSEQVYKAHLTSAEVAPVLASMDDDTHGRHAIRFERFLEFLSFDLQQLLAVEKRLREAWRERSKGVDGGTDAIFQALSGVVVVVGGGAAANKNTGTPGKMVGKLLFRGKDTGTTTAALLQGAAVRDECLVAEIARETGGIHLTIGEARYLMNRMDIDRDGMVQIVDFKTWLGRGALAVRLQEEHDLKPVLDIALAKPDEADDLRQKGFEQAPHVCMLAGGLCVFLKRAAESLKPSKGISATSRRNFRKDNKNKPSVPEPLPLVEVGCGWFPDTYLTT
jgi:hypothetical protein